ncbi:MAG TPA: hypothetical protein VEW45_07065 [Candidatus Dormibacteraeota bacterium]|nr:hypothetical protein [Candidatus Dormibacteraeota bacterium]
MNEPDPRPWRRAALAPLALVAVLGVASFVRPGDSGGALLLANPDRSRVTELRVVLAALPDQPLVLVGLDPDLGTYAEIRTTVRAAFDDLRRRDARLAIVSFTPEGRAVAAAELDRLARTGFAQEALLDLGFIAGAEAGMVRAVTALVPVAAEGSLAGAVREAGGGMGAFDIVLVVGGGDLGPRTWVEQVGTRLPGLPIVAIAPTFAQPELAPYLRTGQLAALLATLRDGAAYASSVAAAAGPPNVPNESPERVPSALAMLIGMLLALVVLGRTLLASAWGGAGSAGPTETDGRHATRSPRAAAERAPSDEPVADGESAANGEPTGDGEPVEGPE